MSSSERPHKGSPYAQELITHLQPYCTPRKTERGEQLDFKVNGQGVCYLILEGTVAVYRRNDNMMLSTARSPAVLRICIPNEIGPVLLGSVVADFACQHPDLEIS